MADDEARTKILSRRRRFVWAALAGAGLSTGVSGCCDSEGGGMGQPCLSMPEPPPDASGTAPAPSSKPPKPG